MRKGNGEKLYNAVNKYDINIDNAFCNPGDNRKSEVITWISGGWDKNRLTT